MTGLIFHYVNGLTNIPFKLWDEMESMWDFSPLIMIDCDNEMPRRKEHTYPTLEEAMKHYEGTFIALDALGDTLLKDFVMPEGDVYFILGRNDIHGSLDNLNGIQKVRIDQPKSPEGRWLWDIEAAFMLAYELHR